MAWPMIAAAGIGAGAQLFGSLMGAGAAKEQAALQRAQLDLGFKDYYMRKRLADQQLAMAQAGSIDARGDKTEYVQGVGWITRPTETTRGLISASDAEERNRLTVDAIRRRLAEGNQFNDSVRSRADADATQANRIGAQSLDDVKAAMLRRAGASSANNMGPSLGVAALRGTGNIDTAIDAANKSAGNSRRTAMAEADAGSISEYLARNTARLGDINNRANAMRTMANTPIGTVAPPTSIDDNLSAFLANRAQSGMYGMATNTRPGFTPQNIQESRLPIAVAGIGASVEKLLSNPRVSAWLEKLFDGGEVVGTGQNYADAYARAQASGYSPF